MFVNVNEDTLPVTASSTPTTYALPNPTCNKVHIVNDAGGTVIFKLETTSVATLVAPVAGTQFKGTPIANQSSEMYGTNQETQYITIYSATGTGTVYIQSTNGDK